MDERLGPAIKTLDKEIDRVAWHESRPAGLTEPVNSYSVKRHFKTEAASEYPLNKRVWTNWAETVSCQPTYFHHPENYNQIAEILAYAKLHDETVRVVGSGHSPNDIACTDGHAISLARFNRIINIDRSNCVVTVESGIVIHDLNSKLEEAGLALSNLGSISELTLGGALAVGTHGTGIGYGILATAVLELDIIIADGSELHCSPVENAEIFKAALCSLGAIGIITTVTLKVEPLYYLNAVQYPLPLHTVLLTLDGIMSSAEHSRFWWFPHTDYCIVWQANRSSEKSLAPSWIHQKLNDIKSKAIGYYSLEFSYWLSTLNGLERIVPYINKLYRRLLYSKTQAQFDLSYKVFNFDCLFKQYVMEWAVPIRFARIVLLKIKRMIDTKGIGAHFPIEVRFVNGDDIWLSPAYGEPHVYIGVILYRPYGNEPRQRTEYFDAIADIMEAHEGRPHWAKAHSWNYEKASKSYPKWQDFCRLRNQLDPTRLFWNRNLERLFVPGTEFI